MDGQQQIMPTIFKWKIPTIYCNESDVTKCGIYARKCKRCIYEKQFHAILSLTFFNSKFHWAIS